MRKEFIINALESYERKLVRYAMHLVGDLEHAQDIVQDTFLSMWEENEENMKNHLAPWLFKVCRNKAFDVIRKDKRIGFMGGESEITCENPKPDNIYEIKEASTNVIAIIENLPKKQREVIVLKFQNDLSYQEISELTGLSISNIGYLIHTGIKMIQQRIINKGGERYEK